MNPADVVVHVQRGGFVVMTAVTDDGRTLRVCGARPDRGCVVAVELFRALRHSRAMAARCASTLELAELGAA